MYVGTKQNEVGQKIQFRSLAQDRDKKVNITQPLKCLDVEK